ncbi:MAG: DNA polymerase III subunit gamma/tau [Oceanicoccus sp.]
MSYQVLARKWRPKTFREMVGQEHVLKALINALDHNRLHHAYLFTGTRGVGKTSIARILAKCLNCDVGVSSEPCGQCSACLSISEGRFVDLIEVDAASRTKVEDTRELLENVQYAPTAGRFKVYLIDEVHMLSTNSFNALLKTLEEPPPHVKFLLATTDPQKLPATILSRCLQFNLKNMSPERIVTHLHNVLEQEMISFEEPALWLLGRAADGSMRDALSLTDQAISFGSGKLLEADVRSMLGTIDRSAVYKIVEALIAENGAQLLAAVVNMAEHAPDYLSALEELLMVLHRIAIAQAVPDATDNSFGDGAKIIAISSLLTAEDTQLFYQIGLNGRRDLSLAPDLRSGFEMVLLRMLAFKPAGIAELPERSLTNRPVSVEAPQPVKKPEAGVQSTKADTPVNSRTELAEELAPVATEEQAVVDVVSQAIVEDAPPTPSVAELVADIDREILIDEKIPLSLDQLRPDSWNTLFERLGFGGVVGNIASHCILANVTNNVLHLQLDAANATLFSDSYTARIQEHLTVTLNTPVTVKIDVKPLSVETPALRKNRLQTERRQAALLSLKNDPNVQILVSDFDAVLDEESVQPVS